LMAFLAAALRLARMAASTAPSHASTAPRALGGLASATRSPSAAVG
jgi:hypothetical protein